MLFKNKHKGAPVNRQKKRRKPKRSRKKIKTKETKWTSNIN